MRNRTVFLSDIHLGTPGCQADMLLDFLDKNPADAIYLIGDIIDAWQLRRLCRILCPGAFRYAIGKRSSNMIAN